MGIVAEAAAGTAGCKAGRNDANDAGRNPVGNIRVLATRRLRRLRCGDKPNDSWELLVWYCCYIKDRSHRDDRLSQLRR